MQGVGLGLAPITMAAARGHLPPTRSPAVIGVLSVTARERSVPDREGGSALGTYQVIRSVGFAAGSALAASILAGHTAAGAAQPSEQGYVTALWIGAGLCVPAAIVAISLPDGGSPAAAAADAAEELLH